MTVAFATGAPSAGCDGWTSSDWTVVYQLVHRLQVRIAKAVEDAAGSLNRPLKGLSCLLGNWHGQFLEGWGLVTASGYSACNNMGFLKKLFGKQTELNANEPEHAVIVNFQYGSHDLDKLFVLEEKLEKKINAGGVGEYDGNEVAADGSHGTLYMYGTDADDLFSTVRPILEATSFMEGARITLRYGPPGEEAKETEVELGT